MEQTTVQMGKSITVGAKTFKPGDTLPEYLMKQFQSSKEYRNFFTANLIPMKDYLKEQDKKEAAALKEAEKNKTPELSEDDLTESDQQKENNIDDDVDF